MFLKYQDFIVQHRRTCIIIDDEVIIQETWKAPFRYRNVWEEDDEDEEDW